jgi:hypothetical protein
MLGSAFVLSLGDSSRKGALQLGAMLVYAGGVVAFAVSTIFPVSLVVAGLLGFCDTIAGTMRRSLIQLSTPDELQGRVGAVQSIVGSGGPALGGAQAGLTASLVGAPLALVVGGAICGAVAVGTALRGGTFRRA